MAGSVLAAFSLSATETVDLAWDPSPDAGVTNYRIHYGPASGAYTTVTNAGLATTLTVRGLIQGTTYYFAATAVGTNQLESDFSNEISYQVPGGSVNAPPTISTGSNPAIYGDPADGTVAFLATATRWMAVRLNATGPAPLSPASHRSTLEDVSPAPLSFTIDDAETPATDLVISVTSTNPALVPVGNIAIGGSGANRTLSIAPVPNASGTTRITLLVSDGQTSVSRWFLLTVRPVNDPPTLDPIANLTLPGNVGTQQVALTGISAGPGEDGQMLKVTAQSSNPALVPGPELTYDSPGTSGILRLVPVPGATGSAVVTVSVRDDGGTLDGGVDTVTRTFTVSGQPQAIAADAIFASGATAASSVAPTGPTLSLQIDEKGLILSWSDSAGEYVLERANDPSGSATWTTVNRVPEVHGAQRSLRIDAALPREFFRLKKGPPPLSRQRLR